MKKTEISERLRTIARELDTGKTQVARHELARLLSKLEITEDDNENFFN